jgi:hypothetical protein
MAQTGDPRMPQQPLPPPPAPTIPPPPAPTMPAPPLDERVPTWSMTPADAQPLRWGPIVAGTLTAIGIFVLLTLLAIAVGVQAAPGVESVDDMDAIGIVVTSAIALVAFFVGGFVATWSAAVSQTGRALFNGFLVWTLWLVAVAFRGAFGLGSISGAIGERFGQMSVSAPEVEAEALLDVLRTASWTSFLAMALTALAAMLGSAVATREELRVAWARRQS